ncbi:SRPBCC family protein [Amycolatopsis palatopharyngis]|uniref:SRPBCC family protein n=1 Tax=Amycolatopsis palatopharyngis TaxID=187982 RepID=UPI000E2894BD|nr:SRPBCC domain-containing protein [Amycolatopsis palatopharyngis]
MNANSPESGEGPRIEVTIAASEDEVWQALRKPELIRRWHGWHFDGLDDEVRTIYTEGVTEDSEQHSLTVQGGDRFSLHRVEDATVVRITRSPRGLDPDWDVYYDDITEGWTTFLHQLRFAVERHGLAERQTLVLEGILPDQRKPFAQVLGLGAVAELAEGKRYRATLTPGDDFAGTVYARTQNQLLLTVDALGDGLLVVAQQPRNPHRPDGGALAVLTAYDTDPAGFAALATRWSTWWKSVNTATATATETE